MDTTAILIMVLFALIVVAAFLIYRRRIRFGLKGPLGTGLDLDGTNADQDQRDALRAQHESRIGNVSIDGAAPTTDVQAIDRSQIGDVTIKRPRK